MQNAKDTFYEVLRDRLTTVNPERTTVLRGVTRPALIVTENELLSNFTLPDCFYLHWATPTVEAGELPLVTLQCEIAYETAGAATNGGMDRGRALSAMDAELCAALRQDPRNTQKQDYSTLANGDASKAMVTNVWWGTVEFGNVTTKNDRLTRTARVAVMSYQEAGEL